MKKDVKRVRATPLYLHVGEDLKRRLQEFADQATAQLGIRVSVADVVRGGMEDFLARTKIENIRLQPLFTTLRETAPEKPPLP